jgi:hypothetical protein
MGEGGERFALRGLSVPNPMVTFRWHNPVIKYRRRAIDTAVKPTVDVSEIAQ